MGQSVKRDTLLGQRDLTTASGLEIGPRDSPMLRKADCRVRYVDYAPTEIVRANAVRDGLDPDDVVDVDIVWGERALRDCLDAPVDYIVAAHVVEHVPDLIGWLNELHGALVPGGTLGLAVPDRRFTFDRPRPESGLGEMVEAYVRQYRQPSMRQVFESAALSTAVDQAAAWRGEVLDERAVTGMLGKLPDALRMARDLADNPRYVDAHCWTFTPASMLARMEQFAWMGLFPFAVELFRPTEIGWPEFYVRLRALEHGERDTALGSIAAAQALVRDAQSEALYALRHGDDPDLVPIRQRMAWLEARVEGLEREIQEQERAFRGSASWRVTAPLRALSSGVAGLRARVMGGFGAR